MPTNGKYCLCGHEDYMHNHEDYPEHVCIVIDKGIQCDCKRLNLKPTLEEQEQEALKRIRRARAVIKPNHFATSFSDDELTHRLDAVWWMLTLVYNELNFQVEASKDKEDEV